MKKYLLPFLSILLIAVGCYEDADNTPPPRIIIETTEVIINTSISGAVVDQNGDFLEDYMLEVNDKINNIHSDYFFLELEDLKKKGQTIHVFKDNMKIGIHTHLLVENDINHMEILRHPAYQQKTITDINNELDYSKSLVADFSSVKWENGYEGNVNVDYVAIEPSNKLTPVGYNTVSDLLAVDSRGGFYLSAYNEDGENIIAQNDFPILLKTSDLDEDINSLFVFNEENEIWVLVADFTSGDEVEILGEGYYTFANYTPGVFVEGVVKKEETPVAYQPMSWYLTPQKNQICATEKGNWIALLPEQESVEINLLNPCHESVQTETLDVAMADINNQNLIVEESDNYQQLNFTVIDCNEEVVAAPNLNLTNAGSSVQYVFSDDYPNRWIAVCDEFGIAAVNQAEGESGPELDWSTEIDGNLDVLTDCSAYNQGFSFIRIREDEKIYGAFEMEVIGEKTVLKSQDEKVKFIFRGNQEGMYNVDEVNVLIDDEDFGDKGYYIKCENSVYGCGIDDFNVTHFQSGNGTIRATFSGTLWMQTLSPSVAGNFDVEGVIVIKL